MDYAKTLDIKQIQIKPVLCFNFLKDRFEILVGDKKLYKVLQWIWKGTRQDLNKKQSTEN